MFLIKHKGCRAKAWTVENQRVEDEQTGFRVNYSFVDEGGKVSASQRFQFRIVFGARSIGGGSCDLLIVSPSSYFFVSNR